jgi:hypothetical protein
LHFWIRILTIYKFSCFAASQLRSFAASQLRSFAASQLRITYRGLGVNKITKLQIGSEVAANRIASHKPEGGRAIVFL